MSELQNVTIDRRTVLLAGGTVAVAGTLAACGGGDAAGGSDLPATDTPTTGGDSPGSAGASSGNVIAKLADVPVGGGLLIARARLVLTQPVAGEVHAFSSVCPHQGCQVETIQDNTITCPCHFSTFSAQDGAVISGPAPTGLEALAVTVQGDDIVLA